MTHPNSSETDDREIDARIRRRAWADPRVRSWWIAAAAFAVIAAYLAADSFSSWNHVRRAVESGVFVSAKVIWVGEGDMRVGKKVSSTDTVGLQYSYNGKNFDVIGTLAGLTDFTAVGATVPVSIDPNDPSDWTSLHEVTPLATEMIGPMLTLPVAVIAFVIAWLGRSNVLRTYARGTRVTATVTSNKQTPIAPRCRAVGAAVPPSGRVVEVFVPPAFAKIAPGDAIELILPPGKGRVIAAAWME